MNKGKTLRALTVAVIFLGVLLLAVGAGFYILFTNYNKEKVSAKEAQEALSANKQMVYVALDDLSAGTVLEENVNVALEENLTSLPASLYVQADDLGKTLLIPVSTWEPVMKSMVTDEIYDDDTREIEVGVANLMLDQKINDYIDIRILFPDGSDYMVASKLKVKRMSLENSLFYCNMGEDQLLTLSAATIDAYTITGTKIYITRYVAPNMQKDGVPNYPVRQETLLLMASDPNILKRAEQTLNAEARAALESRLALLSEEQLEAVNTGHGLTDTAHAQAFVTGQQENISVYENEQQDVIVEDNNQ